jgi:hypothetical protein
MAISVSARGKNEQGRSSTVANVHSVLQSTVICVEVKERIQQRIWEKRRIRIDLITSEVKNCARMT